ncbi:25811_t:CDS:1, partial [Gigaspora rosea]
HIDNKASKMFKSPFKKISNIFRSSLKTPPSINFKRFFSPVTNIPRPFSPPPPSIRQQRNFFGFDAMSSRRSYTGHKVLGFVSDEINGLIIKHKRVG